MNSKCYTLLIKFDDTLSEDIKEKYTNHKCHHEGDSGVDLYQPEDQNIGVSQLKKLDLKIKCAMVDQNNNLCSYRLAQRSSISKYPLQLANCEGIIDSGYRGNLIAAFHHYLKDLTVDDSGYVKISQDNLNFKVDKGMRLVQIVGPTMDPIKVKIVDELPDSTRGDGGFGSTGK